MMVLDERSGDHQSAKIPQITASKCRIIHPTVAERFHSEPQIHPHGSAQGKSGITKVMRIHPLGIIDIYITICANPSRRC